MAYVCSSGPPSNIVCLGVGLHLCRFYFWIFLGGKWSKSVDTCRTTHLLILFIGARNWSCIFIGNHSLAVGQWEERRGQPCRTVEPFNRNFGLTYCRFYMLGVYKYTHVYVLIICREWINTFHGLITSIYSTVTVGLETKTMQVNE